MFCCSRFAGDRAGFLLISFLRRGFVFTAIGVLIPGIVLGNSTLAADELAPVQEYLTDGRLSDAAEAMTKAVRENADDQQARFSLGVVQFFQAVEGLGHDHYRYGLLADRRRQITFMRLPVPENPKPDKLSYEAARQIIQNYVTRLMAAEKTLAAVKPTGVKLPLQIGQVRLDLDGNGKATDEESLWQVLVNLQGRRPTLDKDTPSPMVIAFDDADVLWLRGYCHVMSGLGEILLAYDWHDQFERTAHLFYPIVETPYPYLAAEGPGFFNGFSEQNVLDLLALIHTINYDVVEPARMKVALAHFEEVIQLSRQSFSLIESETDDDREWIPNERQTSVLAELRVGRNMVTSWRRFLDEMELILQGKKLLPFWRGVRGGITIFGNRADASSLHPTLGINVRRIFTEPGRFDLVLWLQGTGLQPYLEEGDRSDVRTWQEISREFNGQFLTFMFWFN